MPDTPTVFNQLMELVRSEGIFLDYQDLSYFPCKTLGLYCANIEGVPVIVLDESLKENEGLHVAVLAEELGHHFCPPTSSILDPKARQAVILRDEQRALWWAVKFLSNWAAESNHVAEKEGN